MGITLLTTQGSCLQEGAQPGKGSQNSSPAKGQGRDQGEQFVFPSGFPPSIFFHLLFQNFKISLGEMPAIFLKDLPMSVPNWEPRGLKWICFSNLANNREQFPHSLRCIFSCVKSHLFFLLQSKQIIKHIFSQSESQYLLITL